MADHSAIEWTDATWNPVRGCSRVSEGCRNCYAERVAARFSRAGQPYEGLIHPKTRGWNGRVHHAANTLTQPVRWRRPRRIFVNSMSDLFHEAIPDSYIDAVFGVMWACQFIGRNAIDGHVFQILTKRPARMLEYFRSDRREAWATSAVHYGGGFDPDGLFDQTAQAVGPHPRIWLGVSVEDQATADERIPLLLRCPAAVHWVSAEPLLGPIKFRPYTLLDQHCFVCKAEDQLGEARGTMSHPINCAHRLAHRGDRTPACGIGWVVAGGESGAGARPMHPDWARSLRDQCAAAGVPFLFKQWGEFAPNDRTVAEVARSDRKLVPVPLSSEHPLPIALVDRVGKRAAGRHLDGVLHDAYPEARA